MTRFETDRLRIRDLEAADLPFFAELQGDPEVMRYVEDPLLTEEQAPRELEKIIACYEEKDNDLWIWAIDGRHERQFLGTCALVMGEQATCEIGYRLLRSHWGKGYATELVDPLVTYAFRVLQAREVVALADRANMASVRTLERSRLKFTGEYWNEKVRTTDLSFRATRDEWLR